MVVRLFKVVSSEDTEDETRMYNLVRYMARCVRVFNIVSLSLLIATRLTIDGVIHASFQYIAGGSGRL